MLGLANDRVVKPRPAMMFLLWDEILPSIMAGYIIFIYYIKTSIVAWCPVIPDVPLECSGHLLCLQCRIE